MADYRTYLASSILTEDKIITYRVLSRALKVNANVAKEMLYEFHRQQNGKKPGTIHATYLLAGTIRQEEVDAPNGDIKKDGDDDYMQSSPFVGSSMPQPEETTGESSVLTITLVREENLEEIRSQYEYVSSIHVYSIGPHPLKDLQVLSDATREIQELCIEEDPLEFAAKYGTIVNKNVKRRTGKRPPPPAPVTAPVPKPAAVPKVAVKPEPKASKPSSANDFFGKPKEKSKEKPKPAEGATSDPSSKETTPNPPALKRESSSIFKSFAKAKPKIKREETESSAADSPAAEDSPMKDVDDDDEEDTWVPEPVKIKTEIVDIDRKSRKEREAALKKMMEDDDEEEEEVIATPAAEEEVEEVAVEKEASVEKEEPPVVSGGRRRGRRRVMKKKTVKDEEGYLVTKEEPVWESFSEDEPAEKAKPKPQFTGTTAKGKKGAAAKAGQGSIMSFFGKK